MYNFDAIDKCTKAKSTISHLGERKMNTIKKIRHPQLKAGVMLAFISASGLHATDALSSGPVVAASNNETASAPVFRQAPHPDAAPVIVVDKVNLAALDQPSLSPDEPPSQALVAGDDRYPYVEGSQLNRPSDTVMPTGNNTYGLIPVIPEASIYSMMSFGLLGLFGMRKWKNRSG